MILGSGVGLQVEGCKKTPPAEQLCSDPLNESCINAGLAIYTCHTMSGKYRGETCAEVFAQPLEVQAACSDQYPAGCLLDCKGTRVLCDGFGDTGNASTGVGSSATATTADVTGADDSTGLMAMCDGWDPGSEITMTSGVRHIEQSFIDDLVANSLPLLYCDSARFEVASSGAYYEVVDAVSGDFFYEVGLRNGDVVKSLNGASLATDEDVAEAFGDFYVAGPVGSHTLEVERYVGAALKTIKLHYAIDP